MVFLGNIHIPTQVFHACNAPGLSVSIRGYWDTPALDGWGVAHNLPRGVASVSGKTIGKPWQNDALTLVEWDFMGFLPLENLT